MQHNLYCIRYGELHVLGFAFLKSFILFTMITGEKNQLEDRKCKQSLLAWSIIIGIYKL